MNITIPESLREFIERQATAGRRENADAFVTDLLQKEPEVFDRLNRGEAFPVDEHYLRRLETLLVEAELSGDYVEVSSEDFDAMECEAKELARRQK